LLGVSKGELIERRYARFRAFGEFTDGRAGDAAGT
jgi:hypothetical protein